MFDVLGAPAASTDDPTAVQANERRLHMPPPPETARHARAGVLLYYKYLELGEEGREAVRDWYQRACELDGLQGRCAGGSWRTSP